MRAFVLAALVLLVAPGCGWSDPEGPAVVAGVPLAPNDLRLDSFWKIPKSHHLVAALTGGNDFYSGSSSSYFRGDAKDLLFFDASSKRARWLLADPAKRLRSYEFLLDPPPRDVWSQLPEQLPEDTVCLGVLFEVVPEDPEKDRPAAVESAAIGIANADGSSPTILIPSASKLLGSHLLGRDSLVVFYVRGGELWSAEIAPAARTILSDAVVSASPDPR
jgi:hypothetical protein